MSDHDPYERDLREIARVAGDLVAGNGGPKPYEKPASGMSALPDYQRADVKIACLQAPHKPQLAMVLTGLILFGFDFEDDYARLGIPGNFAEGYAQLQARFGAVKPQRQRVDQSGAPALADLSAALSAAASPKRRGILSVPLSRPTSSATALPGRPARVALPER